MSQEFNVSCSISSLSLSVFKNPSNIYLWLTGWILGVSNQILLRNARKVPVRKNMHSTERTELRGLSPATFWTCEMGHEESGISALDRQHWPQTSLSVVCKDRFVRTGECSSGSAGRLEKWIIAFPFDVLGHNYWMFLIWVSIGCQVEQLLFSPVCQVDSIWIIIRSKRPLCISPSLSQSHLWPPRWQQSPALTSLLNHHISDSLSYQRWMECLQTGNQTRSSQEALRDALPNATRPPEHVRGKCGEISHKTLLVSSSISAHSRRICTNTHIHTPAWTSCSPNFLSNFQDERLIGFNILEYQEK